MIVLVSGKMATAAFINIAMFLQICVPDFNHVTIGALFIEPELNVQNTTDRVNGVLMTMYVCMRQIVLMLVGALRIVCIVNIQWAAIWAEHL